MEEINPFAGEQLDLVEELKTELERLDLRREYLLELLEYYENRNLPTDLQTG